MSAKEINSAEFSKNQNDNREFKYVTLPNQMRCLLVSDPEAKNSAACTFVGVGSLDDPVNPLSTEEPKKRIEGMAHFCEHMLFLGTKKYPSENHYQQFLQANGGDSNAATGEEYTYYYFDVEQSKFAEVLDIYSQFFKEPLFNESAVEREL